MTYKSLFSAVIVGIALTEIYYRFLQNQSSYTIASGDDRKLLVIGILSSPNHFENRQAIRTTWGGLLPGKNGDLKFIVGSKFCHVPPEDRATPYVCQEWSPQIPKDESVVLTNIKYEPDLNEVASFQAYTFLVKQAISVTELCVCGNLLSPANTKARVLLYDSYSGEVVASATFVYDFGLHSNGILKKRIKPLELEALFEGEIKIITNFTKCSCPFYLSSPSAVHIFEVLDCEGKYVEFSPAKKHPVLGGYSYTILNIEKWRSYTNSRQIRELAWKKQLTIIENQLKQETTDHNDIIFVDVVDVYASLDFKLLLFLQWLSFQNYKFLLKTDDDVFLDVVKIVKELEQNKQWDWWSCFKMDWRPPNAGKWRDRLSTFKRYPPFPSGSGYVIKIEALQNLPLNATQNLARIGEDVFVGILASTGNFKTLDKSLCYWACDYKCNRSPCNIPELSPNQMRNAWASYQNCSEICDC